MTTAGGWPAEGTVAAGGLSEAAPSLRPAAWTSKPRRRPRSSSPGVPSPIPSRGMIGSSPGCWRCSRAAWPASPVTCHVTSQPRPPRSSAASRTTTTHRRDPAQAAPLEYSHERVQQERQEDRQGQRDEHHLRPVQHPDHHDADHRRRQGDLARCHWGTADTFATNQDLQGDCRLRMLKNLSVAIRRGP